jgi:hypothetical protein
MEAGHLILTLRSALKSGDTLCATPEKNRKAPIKNKKEIFL